MSRAPAALLLAAALVPAFPALAHHSFARYESTKTLTLTGTVETFDWSNPHVMLQVLVQEDGDHAATEWKIVTSAPGILQRFGWDRQSLKRGDRVVVIFNPMIDGSHLGRLHTLTRVADSKVLRTKLSGA
jgi:hypothetical protein